MLSLSETEPSYAIAAPSAYAYIPSLREEAPVFNWSTPSVSAGTNKLKTDLEAGKTKATESYNTAYGSFYKVAFAVTCMSQGINPNSATPQQQAVIAAAMAQSGISQTPDVTSKTQYALATGYILKNYASVAFVFPASRSVINLLVPATNWSEPASSFVRPPDNASAPVTICPAPDKALSIPASSVTAPAARSLAPLAAEATLLSRLLSLRVL